MVSLLKHSVGTVLFVFALVSRCVAQLPADIQGLGFVDFGRNIFPSSIDTFGLVVLNSPAGNNDIGAYDTFLYQPGKPLIPATGVNGSCVATLRVVDSQAKVYGDSLCRAEGADLCDYVMLNFGGGIAAGRSRVLDLNDFGDRVGTCEAACVQGGFPLAKACVKFFDEPAERYLTFNDQVAVERGQAVSINNNRLIVGRAGGEVDTTLAVPEKAMHGFIWDPFQGIRNLDELLSVRFEPVGINDRNIVVGKIKEGTTDQFRSFLLDGAAAFADGDKPLAEIVPPPGSNTVSARSINNQTQVVGTFGTAGLGLYLQHAFLYRSGTFYDLNLLAIPGFVLNEAIDISDHGEVIGIATNIFTGAQHGFLLTKRNSYPIIRKTGSCAKRPLKRGKKCSVEVRVRDLRGQNLGSASFVLLSGPTPDGPWTGVASGVTSAKKKVSNLKVRISNNVYLSAVVGPSTLPSFGNAVSVTTK